MLEQAAQGSGEITNPGNVQKECGCGTHPVFKGEQSSAEIMVGFDDFKGLLQP